VWKGWILLVEIQTNWKIWVSKEKSIERSMCSHCQIKKKINYENVKNKKYVHIWANNTSYIIFP
jgi:hypothetical protein